MDVNQNPSLLSISESSRKLPDVDFVASSTFRSSIPCDTIVKRIELRLSGIVTTTFASGTPVADAFATFDNLITGIQLRVDGYRTVKSIRPYFQRQLQLLQFGQLPERKSSAGAAAATNNNPTADGGFAYGSTTNITTVAETITIFFECPFLKEEQRSLTLLNLKGRSTCELQFSSAAYSALLGFGNTAPVVYSADDFVIGVTLVEDRSMGKDQPFVDYVQTYQSQLYSAAANGNRFKLPISQFLMGVSILARNGAAGSATTATGKVADNNMITNLAIVVNGTSIIKQTTFQELQALNRRGVYAPFASNVSAFDGYAHLDLLQNGEIKSALDCRRSVGVDNVELVFDLRSGGTFTNPAEISFETHEWREIA